MHVILRKEDIVKEDDVVRCTVEALEAKLVEKSARMR